MQIYDHNNSGHFEVMDEDAFTKRCTGCNQAKLRIKPSEGIVVCTECGLVDQSSIIDMTKESRNFGAENSNGQQIERTGKFMRLDELNNIYTEFTGGKHSGAQKINAAIARSAADQHIISLKKKKDWYTDFFRNAKKALCLK